MKIDGVIQTLTAKINSLDVEYDPTNAINKALNAACDEFSRNQIAEQKESIESALKPEFDEKQKRILYNIQSEAEDDIEKAKKEHNIARFHLFFEIEVDENETIDRKIDALSNFKRVGLKLNRDFTGDKVILDRQKKALENLEEGYVLNPFLATFLFSPRSESTQPPIQTVEYDFIDKGLNDSQKEAVRMALSSNGLFLIQGPPGTGKTQVIAEISAQLARSNRKVLIASQNNKAVDNAFDRIPKIPSVRLLRVLSDKATKRGNDYSFDELVSNFYTNISVSLDTERHNMENQTTHLEDLKSSIADLNAMYKTIKDCRRDAKSTDDEISIKENNLQSEYKRKDDIENANRSIQDMIDQKQEEIDSIENLSDPKTVNEIVKRVKKAGFTVSEYTDDPTKILKVLHSVERESIIEEYAMMDEHNDYFEFLKEKEVTKDRNKKAELNKQIHEYMETFDFDPQTSIPLLSILNKVPPIDIVLKAKDEMETFISSRVVSLKNSVETRNKGLRTSSDIDEKIRQLKKDIEILRKDPAYTKLKAAEDRFDKKANDIYTKLRITMPPNRDQVLSTLEAEKERFTIPKSKKNAVEECIRTYREISKYISDESIIDQDRDLYNKKLRDTVNVFGMTCSAKTNFKGDGSETISLNERNIDVVIVDEVSKVPFVEILQPILFGKTVILVGDHRQLPPMFNSCLENGEENPYDQRYINESDEKQYRKMYEESFFAKLFDESPSNMKVQLRIQYRMHPDIMEIVNTFYRFGSENGLDFGGNEVQKMHYLDIKGASGRKFLGSKDHTLFVNVRGNEKKESGSTSYTNPDEAKVVLEILKLIEKNMKFDGEGRRLESSYKGRDDPRLSVGVICAYADQAKEIKKHKADYRNFNRSNDNKFMIKTVDDFQGDERDIIILSLVRSKESKFLKDYRRINVTISRARRLLIIVGNKAALERMKVDLDGKARAVYRDILKTIERKDGYRDETDIIGVD